MSQQAIRPDFFIVGAPKCGTTSLYRYLEAHRDVFMPAGWKEPCFFGRDLDTVDWLRVRDLEEYLSLFREAGDAARVGEASVQYLRSADAPQEIKEFNPDAQIIIMLRDPVEAMRSLHWHHVRKGTEPITEFAEAIAAQEDRRAGRQVPANTTSLSSLLYEEAMDFAPQVRRYLDVFGHSAVHVLFFEEFTRDTLNAYRGVLKFLGVDADFRPRFDRYNVAAPARNLWIRRALLRPNFARRAIKKLPRRVRGRLGDAVAAVGGGEQERPPWHPALRAELRERARPGVEALESTLGVDLSHWKYEAAPQQCA